MRDFFYNKGDVLIAILIILIAAFVIYLRVGVIMDYSSTGEKGGSLLPMPPSIEEVIDSVTGSGGAGETAQESEDPAAGETTPNPTEVTPPAQTEEPVTPAEVPAEMPAETTPEPQAENPAAAQGQEKEITVNAGDAASTIADKLLSAGAITDKQAFLSEVMSQGADSKLKMGTFKIPAGATHAEIIKILVG